MKYKNRRKTHRNKSEQKKHIIKTKTQKSELSSFNTPSNISIYFSSKMKRII